MGSLLGLLVQLAALLGLLVMISAIWVWKRVEQNRGRRSPLTRHLLRSPGQSLRSQIDDLRGEVGAYLAVAMLPLPTAIGIYFAEWATSGTPPGVLQSAVLGLFAVSMLGYFAWKLWRVMQKVRELRLGYDAEVAIGQELTELLRHGWRVFHDFPVDERSFNIDHVLVGPGGLFAIETKGRAKPKRKGDSASWEVSYNGAELSFPGWTEVKPLRQAEASMKWLRQWISSAVGEPVHAQAVVVLPGWYVRRTASSGVPVLAGGQVCSYFTSMRPMLDPGLVQRVAHQLEQRCRDVEPAYGIKRKTG